MLRQAIMNTSEINLNNSLCEETEDLKKNRIENLELKNMQQPK